MYEYYRRQNPSIIDFYKYISCGSRTGFTGHPNNAVLPCAVQLLKEGFNPERASQAIPTPVSGPTVDRWSRRVSIPNGLHRLSQLKQSFRPDCSACLFQSRTGFTGYPDLNAPHCVCGSKTVSIPNGLHRLSRPAYRQRTSNWMLRFQSRTGFTGYPNRAVRESRSASRRCFNPERASQAIPTR